MAGRFPDAESGADLIALGREFEAARFAEEAAQRDAGDHLIAILDGLEPRPDDEDGGDDEPSLGAPEGHESQVVWLRGTTRDLDQHPEIGL